MKSSCGVLFIQVNQQTIIPTLEFFFIAVIIRKPLSKRCINFEKIKDAFSGKKVLANIVSEIPAVIVNPARIGSRRLNRIE